MRGLRRKGGADADGAAAELPRLSWPVRRDGEDLVISVIPSRVPGDERMRVIDMVPEDGETAPELTQAADAPGTVAIQGFTLSTPDGGLLSFTLAVSLADIPYPETAELPEHDVSECRLACGPALRIFKWTEPGTETDPGPPVSMFGTTYLAQTDYGVLALAFATPHVDGAREFAVLFEAIAQSCTIQPAESASATAT
ncbi:MAG TPA: hypothetical protein VMF57_09975 [Solirubrobacteraceae bacterium]|nr:hypothetical protein [Solirubrobacteraceae bacterium]